MKIRQMRQEDIDSVLKLEENHLDSSLGRDHFVLALDSEYSYYLVAEEDNNIVGYISSTIDEYSEILNFVVDGAYQGNGIGTKLLLNVIDKAIEKKSKSIYLEVNEINVKAISIYLKNGFKKDHIRKNYYKNNDAYVLIKEL